MVLLLAPGFFSAAQSPLSTPKPEANPFYEKLKRPWQLLSAGKLDEAAAGYRTILEEAVAARDQQAQAWCHSGLGNTLYNNAHYPAARTEYEQGLALYQLGQDEPGVARAHSDIGAVAAAMGDSAFARQHYRIALEIYRKLKMLPQQAIVLGELALADDPEGPKLDEEALAIARQIGDKGLEADAQHRIGDGLFLVGQFEDAQERLTRAAALYRELGAKYGLARVLTSEGRLERAHGHPEKSLELYRDALKLQQEVGDRQGEIQSTNAMAVTYGYLRDYVHSIDLYWRALALAKDTGSARIITFQSANLAGALISVGRNEEAVDLLKELVGRDQDHPDVRYDSLAAAYLNLGRNLQAKEAADKAVERAGALGHIENLHGYLVRRAYAEWKLGEKEAAINDAQEALRVIEKIRAHLVPSDYMKRGFAETTMDAFDLTIRLLVEVHQPGRALEVAEQARSRAFLDLLATHDLQGARGQALMTLRKVGGELAAAGFDPSSAAPDASGRVLWDQWTSADPELRSLVSVPSISFAQLQAAALRLNSTILSYWVSADATYIWVIPPIGEIHVARAEIPDKKLKEKIVGLWPGGSGPVRGEETAVRSGVQVDLRGGNTLALNRAGQKSWRELYKLLIRPIEKWLPTRSGTLLTIEAHGPLLKLPFAALQNEQGQYLLERFTLHFVPAISLLQFTEKKKQQVARATPEYLLVADPANTPPSPIGKPLPALPGARREVSSIARLMPTPRVTMLEGKEASEPRVEELARRSTVIHFATHGLIRDDHPLDSFLALGRAGSDPDRDGHLTVEKVYALDLHSDLVFLSACRSGNGEVTGDGINGLTRAFLYAGTPSVIASLWDVADATAQQLVTGFYRSWLRGSDKARALRSAQLGLLRALRTGQVAVHTAVGDFALPEDPVFWASFVLQGEP
jgi:CHAT domain-containing protein/tetratricopeptide (TPR) repeat protein